MTANGEIPKDVFVTLTLVKKISDFWHQSRQNTEPSENTFIGDFSLAFAWPFREKVNLRRIIELEKSVL